MNPFVLTDCMIAYRALDLLSIRIPNARMPQGEFFERACFCRFTSEVSFSIPAEALKSGLEDFSALLLEPAIEKLAADMNLHSGDVPSPFRFVIGVPPNLVGSAAIQHKVWDDERGALLIALSPGAEPDTTDCRIVVTYDVEKVSLQ